ncbi:MAG TPA: hypothetical protein VKM55_17385 [Candidatus Lokiarchaeia archaeon]|nr:hypothetical protein [Candidatus Lokiarchaeia archaeon]
MKYSYNREMKPPGLMVPTILSDLPGINSTKIDSEIDTGGGISSIPVDIVKAWNLVPFESIDARGTFGSFKDMEVDVIRVKFENGKEIKAKVIKNNRCHVILGRNVINYMILQSDGPGRFFMIE